MQDIISKDINQPKRIKVKVADLKPSPFYADIYSPEPPADLVESIRLHGVLVPILISADNTIISGVRRAKVVERLGITEIVAEIMEYSDLLVVESNRYRKKICIEIIKETEALEKIYKLSHGGNRRSKEFQDVNKKLGRTLDIIAAVNGLSGSTLYKLQYIYAHKKELIKNIDAGKITIYAAYDRIKIEETQLRKQQERSQPISDKITVDIRCGDFRELSKDIPDNSIDLILTDPPFPKKYLPLYGDMGEVAKRVLKPGGFLITFTYQTYLPEIMERLGKNLTFYWLGGIYLDGKIGHDISRVQFKKLFNRFKPILFYQKPPVTKPYRWFEDCLISKKKDKDFHEWGQSVECSIPFLEWFTKPGEWVFDPFLGGGTNIEACIKTKRNIVGFEINPETFKKIKKRFQL